MPRLCAALFLVALAIAIPATAIVRALSVRLRAMDTPPVPGQVKFERRYVPNTGGIAIFLAIVVPILAGLGLAAQIGARADGVSDSHWLPEGLLDHMGGIQEQTPLALMLVGCLCVLHVLGLIDDRRPLGPWLKLAIMALPALAIPIFSDTRLLTLLDSHVGGPWLSIVVTALWFLVVTNAMNFMDNMDGLAAGTSAVAALVFLFAALMNGQWFVAACLALLLGACVGFLAFNAPRHGGASIFMGDSGSLVIGFLLAFLTVRTTYYAAPEALAGPDRLATSAHWYAVLTPLIVLAVPLYDFTSVVLIRLSQGRSPFVGDLQHLSHRLVARGLSQGAAVVVIWGCTAVTGLGAVFLHDVSPTHALLVGVQTGLMLAVLGLFEYSSASAA